MKSMVFIITIFILCFMQHSMALEVEEMDAGPLLEAYIKGELDSYNTWGPYLVNVIERKIKNEDPNKLLTLLTNYENNPSYSISRLALLYEVRIADLHPSSEIRQEVTYRLVSTLTGPLDSNANVKPNAYKMLLTFTKDDFNESSKELLHNALAKKEPDSTIMEICGVADMKNELSRLKELCIDEMEYMKSPFAQAIPFYQDTGWTARLARARMGTKEEITRCIELTESVRDPNERVLRLLPDIGYIRQPEAIEFLKKYLDSDDRLPPGNPGSKGMLFRNIALSILEDSLKNFPDVWQGGDIEYFRQWMSEQKEWKIIR